MKTRSATQTEPLKKAIGDSSRVRKKKSIAKESKKLTWKLDDEPHPTSTTTTTTITQQRKSNPSCRSTLSRTGNEQSKNRDRTPVTERGQLLVTSNFSPIKTRAIIKKQVKCTERCRLCRTDNDELIICSTCKSKYHLRCLGYSLQSIQLVSKKRKNDWLCPNCVVCSKCEQFIYDAENVQCSSCDITYHGFCVPNDGMRTKHKSDSLVWCCSQCKSSFDTSKRGNSETDQKSISKKQKLKKVTQTVKTPRASLVSGEKQSWRSKLRIQRDLLADSLKDLCAKEISASYERKYRDYETENLVPKKKGKFMKQRKIGKVNDMEIKAATTVKIIDGIKYLDQETDQMHSGAKNEKRSHQISVDYDYKLYEAVKKQLFENSNGERIVKNEEDAAQWVHFDGKKIKVLHLSPYSKAVAQSFNIYVCTFCLTALESAVKFEIHKRNCKWRNPPGNEIYRDGGLSIWEVDGIDEMAYCRRLCLFSKLFLSSKTLHHEVDTFLFYILTLNRMDGSVFIGYFSKEKNPCKNNNLSCLLTIPSVQSSGFGKLLIDLSYKLSLRERKIGGPEHPLSDMGLITYRSYWNAVIISYIRQRRNVTTLCIRDISHETGIHCSDIVSTLLENGMIKCRDNIYLIDVRKAFSMPLKMIRRRVVRDEKLIWEPEFSVTDSSKMGTYVD